MDASTLIQVFLKDYGTRFFLKDKSFYYGIFLSNKESSNKMIKIIKQRIGYELDGDFFMITSYECVNLIVGDTISFYNNRYIVVGNSEVFLGKEVLYRLIHLKMVEEDFGE